VKVGGSKALFYGLIPNIMRNTVMNTVEMVAYDTAKDIVRNKTSFNSESTAMYVLYGFIAGFLGQVCGNPIDIVKTRMMNSGAKYGGNSIACAKDLLKTEGILGFYKGIKPGLFRCCSFNILFFFAVGFFRNQIK